MDHHGDTEARSFHRVTRLCSHNKLKLDEKIQNGFPPEVI